MAERKRQECEAVAAKHGLGEVRRLHRGRAYDWLTPLWRLQFVVPLVGLVVIGLGSLFGPITAAVVVAVGVGLLFAHSYLMPVDRSQGRRWVAICDDGLVTLSQRGGSAAVRWRDVRSTQHLPKQVRHVQLGVVSSGTRYPQAYQVNATTIDDRQVELVIRQFGRQAALVRAIEDRVTPYVLERARRDLQPLGHAAFGPIVVTPTSLIATSGGGSFEVPLANVVYVGTRVLSDERNLDPRLRILSCLPTSQALLELARSLAPDRPEQSDRTNR